MNDDWNAFIGVAILLTLFYLLLSYLKLMAISQYDWKNFQCNPMYMLISSINQDENASVNQFRKCINSV